MSILIKGLQMPNKKSGAVLIIYPNGKCATEDGTILQAVELPPHGRLIDADALFPMYADLLDGRDVQPVIPKIVIDTAPTIIEAEGAESCE